MSCNDKISNFCADPILAPCVDYEGNLGESTKITKDCVTQHDVNEDLYEIVDQVIEKTDVSEIVSDCIDIPENASNADIIILLSNKVCELNQTIGDLQNINYGDISITDFGLIFPDCIVDSCNNSTTTLSEWMQAMMNKINCI